MDRPTRYKVVLLGPSSAGKTSIIHRYMKGSFFEQRPTIGTAFYSREVVMDGRRLVLNIWDTAGMERYKSLVPRYSKGAAVAIIVFDVTDVASYAAAREILADAPALCDADTRAFFVANKADERAAVSADDARDFAEAHDAVFVETSAKTGENIEDLFTHAAALLADCEPATEPAPLVQVAEGDGASADECC
jgi:Ras-related protein Rab-5C